MAFLEYDISDKRQRQTEKDKQANRQPDRRNELNTERVEGRGRERERER